MSVFRGRHFQAAVCVAGDGPTVPRRGRPFGLRRRIAFPILHAGKVVRSWPLHEAESRSLSSVVRLSAGTDTATAWILGGQVA